MIDINWSATILEVILFVPAIIVASWLYDLWKDSQTPNLGCDYCEDLRNLYRSPDRRFWLCRRCMESYLKEGGFSDAEKSAVRDKYKMKPSKKIMPKRKKSRKAKKEQSGP